MLLGHVRRNGLCGPRLARVHVGTLRLKLLRSGAVIVRNTRRVVFMLSGSCPYQDLFRLEVQHLAPGYPITPRREGCSCPGLRQPMPWAARTPHAGPV